MAKKKKQVQKQSPENYIRKNARNLPLHECWINSNWDEGGIANILISRKHKSGNITACYYLVDLYCLGVKDTHYNFNITEELYNSHVEKFQMGVGGIMIEYTLAHNIIFSSLEFADKYGFTPINSFETITEYFLEEDNEDIDLIEIECGKDGKPFYVQGRYHTNSDVNRIMKQLEKSAGAGNYDYLLLLREEKDIVDMSEKEKLG